MSELTEKLLAQMAKMGLPRGGSVPFRPVFDRNRAGEPIFRRQMVERGPRKDKRGLVDEEGRIWIADAAHAGMPEHWDVQIDGGADYIRVGYDGEVVV